MSAQTILTLDNAVNIALENNLSLRRTEIDLAASGYSEKNLWSVIFPVINANASATYRNSLFSDTTLQNSGFSYQIDFGINIGLNTGLPFIFRSIRLAHQANILRYEDARNQLAILVTKRFYALITEKNNLSLLEEVLNLAQRQYTRSETLFRNGFVGELSLTQSRLTLENARYNLSAGQIIYDNNMAEFLSLLGLPIDENVTLSGEVNIVRIQADAEALINEYLHQRPDILRNKQEIERLTNLHRQAVANNRTPSISLSGSYSGRVSGSLNPLSSNPYTDTLSATAAINIPIDSWIPGTSRSQTISAASDSVEKAILDLQMTENAAKTQIRTLTASLRNSWDNIRIANLGFQSAQRSYQLTEQGFQNGTIEALALQDSRNNMANARQRLLQAEFSYMNMILDLSAALNIDWKHLIQIYGAPGE